MVDFRPLPIALVKPEWAEKVVAPAHDSLTDSQRIKFMADNPDSYLSVTRSPEPDSGDTIDSMVDLGRGALDRLLDQEVFGPVIQQFYVYEMHHDSVTQRAIVGGTAVDSYEAKEIKTHEEVHPERLELLTRHFEVVGAQSSPIALAHRHSDVVAEVIERACDTEMLLEVQNYGLRQRVWAIEPQDAELVTDALADEAFYVIDGHHRVGTAVRYMNRNDNEAGKWAHTALFAADQLNNLAYHRVLNQMTPETFLAAIEGLEQRRSELLPGDQAYDELAFHTGLEWVLVRLPVVRHAEDPLAHLDPVVLQREILGPLFDIRESDARVSYRPGEDQPEDVAALVLGDGILCCMRPIEITDLLAVADAGKNMPPKSTYFSPKVRSGLFFRPLDY